MSALARLPDTIYLLFGFLILANIGSIFAVFGAAWKITWWAAKVDARLDYHGEVLDDHDEEIDGVKAELTKLQVITPN